MSEVKKCEEHPHLSYYADLDLHAKLALAEGEEQNRDQSAAMSDGPNSEETVEKPKSALRKTLGLLLAALSIVGIFGFAIGVDRLEWWASRLIEEEQNGPALAVLETRLVGGVVSAVAYGVPFFGLIGFGTIHALADARVLPALFVQKRIIVWPLTVFLILSVPILSDLVGPHHMTVRIDRATDQLTVSREYFYEADSELVVVMSDIQTVETEFFRDNRKALRINLKMRDGSKIELIDRHTVGFRNVLDALLRVTDLPYEENFTD